MTRRYECPHSSHVPWQWATHCLGLSSHVRDIAAIATLPRVQTLKRHKFLRYCQLVTKPYSLVQQSGPTKVMRRRPDGYLQWNK